jgi:hypothetical protein
MKPIIELKYRIYGNSTSPLYKIYNQLGRKFSRFGINPDIVCFVPPIHNLHPSSRDIPL